DGEVTPFPEEVAVFLIEPASRSAWVMVCVAVQLVVAPGANGPFPHGLIEPSLSSVTGYGPATATLPSLAIVEVQVITVPVLLYVDGPAPLATMSAFVSLHDALPISDGEVTPFPEEVAVFLIEPASRSACVMVCVAVQLVVAPGANGPLPHGLIEPSLSSVTENGPARVTLPELVIV